MTGPEETPGRLWIRHPLAILAEGADGGIVVAGTRIVGRVPAGAHGPLAALVPCGTRRADRVMAAGRRRVVEGEPLGVDTRRLREAHSRLAKHLFGTV